jgi:enoyl-CoA hydratase/carnithine racemase
MTAELKASRSDSSLILTLINPGQQNALDDSITAAAIETLSKAERNDDIRSIIITGADQHFCGGMQVGRDQETQIATLEGLQNLIETLRSFPKPVIAAVEGNAIDCGFLLALACDLIVAGKTAGFGISPAQIGTWAIGGATWLLPKSLPAQWLTEIFLDGQTLPAARLHHAGLVNLLVAAGDALELALSWAEQLSQRPPHAFEQLKALLSNTSDTTLSEHFALERHALLTRHPGHAG